MATIASLQVLLSAQTAKFDSALKQSESRTKRFAAVAKTAMASVGVAFSGAVVIGGLKKTIDLYGEQERVVAKLDQAIKSTGGAAGFSSAQLQRYASELQKVTTFGDEVTLSATAMMLTFTKIKGPIFKEAIARAQDMATMFGSLEASTLKLGKALNDPLRGMAALQEVGIGFTDQQREQVVQFEKLNDRASAQKVILAELAVQFGGQAQAQAETMAGKIEQMKNAWGDFGETLGSFVAPAIIEATERLKTLQNVMQGPGSRAAEFEEMMLDVVNRTKGATSGKTTDDALKASNEQEAEFQKRLDLKKLELARRQEDFDPLSLTGLTQLADITTAKTEVAALTRNVLFLQEEQKRLSAKKESLTPTGKINIRSGIDLSKVVGLRPGMGAPSPFDIESKTAAALGKGAAAGIGSLGGKELKVRIVKSDFDDIPFLNQLDDRAREQEEEFTKPMERFSTGAMEAGGADAFSAIAGAANMGGAMSSERKALDETSKATRESAVHLRALARKKEREERLQIARF